MANNYASIFDIRLAWQYFTVKRPFMECNICKLSIPFGYTTYNLSMENLENHLVYYHSVLILQKLEFIESSWLSRYFKFDVDVRMIKCILCNCCINIFHKVDYFISHLYDNHHVNKDSNPSLHM